MIRDKIIEVASLKVHLLNECVKMNFIPNPDDSDIWLITHTIGRDIRRFLQDVARSDSPRIYLKPIYLQKENKKFYKMTGDHLYLKRLSDGYVKDLDFEKELVLIDKINTHIKEFENQKIPNLSDYEKILVNCAHYFYIRSRNIIPFQCRKSLSGYSYARIEGFFRDANSENIFKNSRAFLKKAYYEGFLDRFYMDTSHLCSNCKSGFLNYREYCIKCGSHNLVFRNLIHHFRCAYVGKETDFKKEDKLICPKCLSELFNLGVDYDKPGAIYQCSTCTNEFQNAPIKVSCINCGEDQTPNQLTVKKIYKYKFTSKAMEKYLKFYD